MACFGMAINVVKPSLMVTVLSNVKLSDFASHQTVSTLKILSKWDWRAFAKAKTMLNRLKLAWLSGILSPRKIFVLSTEWQGHQTIHELLPSVFFSTSLEYLAQPTLFCNLTCDFRAQILLSFANFRVRGSLRPFVVVYRMRLLYKHDKLHFLIITTLLRPMSEHWRLLVV